MLENLNIPQIAVKRSNIEFRADAKRTITRFFVPGNHDRIKKIIDRILSLTPYDASKEIDSILKNFEHRHRNLRSVFKQNYSRLKQFIEDPDSLSEEQQLLIGSYFTQEYSIESAAFFNPSIVAAPDQTNLPPHSTRVILSFRATGEGHVSSIEFRQGILDPQNNLILDEVSPYIETSQIYRNMSYDKDIFGMRLLEKRIPGPGSSADWATITDEIDIITFILEHLHERFSYKQLQHILVLARKEKRHHLPLQKLNDILNRVDWMARSNYEVHFSKEMPISERVIFPVSANECRGIEDARFVRFVEDGRVSYYATYTAFDGTKAQSQLLETNDFVSFHIHTINGEQAHSKGLAMFPRKINDQYFMICRSDGENLFLLNSDNPTFWHEAKLLQQPANPWDFVQIGNCGSPIETQHGWLLLTHGVGPMRRYCIGISLLDLNDPYKVIARSSMPIIEPNEYEREGYVPNVVYTCGAMIHNNELIIPYAMSDSASSIASVDLDRLFQYLNANRI